MKAARPLWLAAFRLPPAIYNLTVSLEPPHLLSVGSVDTASGEGHWREHAAPRKYGANLWNEAIEPTGWDSRSYLESMGREETVPTPRTIRRISRSEI